MGNNNKDIFSNSGDNENSYDLYSVASGVNAKGFAVKKAMKIRKAVNIITSVILTFSVLLSGLMGYYLIISDDNVGGLKTGDVVSDGYEELDYSENNDATYMLVCGVDLSEKLTDIIVVVCFDHAKNTISCLQIPRDTFIDYDVPTCKMNAVYGSVRKGESNINALRRKLSSHFGIPIDHYVIFTVDGFMNVVDAVGGVKINITQKGGIKIEDQKTYQQYTIGPGWVTLDGNAAAGFVRKRHGRETGYGKGDISRLEAQRLMYVALVKKLKSMGVGTMANVTKSCYNEISTDMTVNQLLGYAKAAKSVEFSNFSVFTLPGQCCTYKKLSMYSLHKQEYVDLYNNNFNPYGEALTVDSIKAIELHTAQGIATTQESYAAEGSSLQNIIDTKGQ